MHPPWRSSRSGFMHDCFRRMCISTFICVCISTLCVFPLWSNTFSLRVFLLCSSIVCACISTLLFQWHSSHPCPNAFHVLEFKAFTIFRFSSSDIVAKETEDASTVKIFPKWVHARLLSANVHKHFHLCVHFYFVCISIVIQHFFFACISIVLQHFFFAYFLCISTLLHISTV